MCNLSPKNKTSILSSIFLLNILLSIINENSNSLIINSPSFFVDQAVIELIIPVSTEIETEDNHYTNTGFFTFFNSLQFNYFISSYNELVYNKYKQYSFTSIHNKCHDFFLQIKFNSQQSSETDVILIS